MSEHKTGQSNWAPEEKAQYRAIREGRTARPFRFTKRGFTYRDGPTAHISKTTVSKKAMRKMTRRARKMIPYLGNSKALR